MISKMMQRILSMSICATLLLLGVPVEPAGAFQNQSAAPQSAPQQAAPQDSSQDAAQWVRTRRTQPHRSKNTIPLTTGPKLNRIFAA